MGQICHHGKYMVEACRKCGRESEETTRLRSALAASEKAREEAERERDREVEARMSAQCDYKREWGRVEAAERKLAAVEALLPAVDPFGLNAGVVRVSDLRAALTSPKETSR